MNENSIIIHKITELLMVDFHVLHSTDNLCFWPPCCVIKLITCCCSVCLKASTNLTHWCSVVRSSSTASLRSYAAFLQSESCCTVFDSTPPDLAALPGVRSPVQWCRQVYLSVSWSMTKYYAQHLCVSQNICKCVWCGNWWMQWQCYSYIHCICDNNNRPIYHSYLTTNILRS